MICIFYEYSENESNTNIVVPQTCKTKVNYELREEYSESREEGEEYKTFDVTTILFISTVFI